MGYGLIIAKHVTTAEIDQKFLVEYSGLTKIEMMLLIELTSKKSIEKLEFIVMAEG